MNVDDGFTFKIKNSLAPATATSVDPIKVDGKEYPLDALIIKAEDLEFIGSEISEDNTVPIKVGVEISLHLKGDQLPEGEHTIDIGIQTKEVGRLAFDVSDAI